MVRESVAFYTGLVITFVGLIVWVIRPNDALGKAQVEFLNTKLSIDVPALAVMVIGIPLMLLSPRLHVEPPKVELVKKTICTGEHEENCPGAHDMYFYCYTMPAEDQLSQQICRKANAHFLKLKTVSGNRCGYALIEATCQPDN